MSYEKSLLNELLKTTERKPNETDGAFKRRCMYLIKPRSKSFAECQGEAYAMRDQAIFEDNIRKIESNISDGRGVIRRYEQNSAGILGLGIIAFILAITFSVLGVFSQ